MRKTFMFCAIASLVTAFSFFSCGSNDYEADKQKVEDAREDLQDAQRKFNEEYPAYVRVAEEKIAANEKRIAELRTKLNEPGKAPLDEMRKKKIDNLEQKNIELRNKLQAYDKESSDWEAFKREFNHDMESIGEAFEDLGKDNKK